jgi:hypothetical protein
MPGEQVEGTIGVFCRPPTSRSTSLLAHLVRECRLRRHVPCGRDEFADLQGFSDFGAAYSELIPNTTIGIRIGLRDD